VRARGSSNSNYLRSDEDSSRKIAAHPPMRISTYGISFYGLVADDSDRRKSMSKNLAALLGNEGMGATITAATAKEAGNTEGVKDGPSRECAELSGPMRM
jgi:hypothetical protein